MVSIATACSSLMHTYMYTYIHRYNYMHTESFTCTGEHTCIDSELHVLTPNVERNLCAFQPPSTQTPTCTHRALTGEARSF